MRGLTSSQSAERDRLVHTMGVHYKVADGTRFVCVGAAHGRGCIVVVREKKVCASPNTKYFLYHFGVIMWQSKSAVRTLPSRLY